MSEGAEWLAQENKRLAERVEQLEAAARTRAREMGDMSKKRLELEQRLEALSEKYWSMRTTITELADEMRKDD